MVNRKEKPNLANIAICLSILCVLLTLVILRLVRLFEKSRYDFGAPEDFQRVVLQTIKRVKLENNWEMLERMRFDLRRGLGEIDKARHDAGNESLHESKVGKSR